VIPYLRTTPCWVPLVVRIGTLLLRPLGCHLVWVLTGQGDIGYGICKPLVRRLYFDGVALVRNEGFPYSEICRWR
jgi:hypothetical protein